MSGYYGFSNISRHNNDDKPLVDTWLIRPNGENIEFHIYTPSNQILFEILPNGNVNLIEQVNFACFEHT